MSDTNDKFSCQYCETTFTNQKNLTYHINNAKYCLTIQGKSTEKNKCDGCEKSFCNHTWLVQHQSNCTEYQILLKTTHFKQQLDEKNALISELLQILRDSKITNEKVRSIEQRIRPNAREQYHGKNFIYILTTPHNTQIRTYIFGKTINLTNRLSTYNKTEEHTVVYYKECKNELVMNSAETAIFSKLDSFRAMKNRERFILPEDKTIEFFTKTVDDCIEFFS